MVFATKLSMVMIYMAVLALNIIISNHVSADPEMLQDVCVADLKSSLTVNGFPCLPTFDASNFFFAGLAKPSLTPLALGSNVTLATVMQIPGLNTLGICMARADFAPGGTVPPHTHPRGTEIIFVLEGELDVGFITTANVLVSKSIKMGDIFVFPRGLVHFQINNGKVPAAVIVAFNSQLPGGQIIATTLFTAMPPVPDNVLAKAFMISTKEVDEIKSKLMPKN